jgi:N-acetylmuramoyl-L-alanine amidase
MWMFRRPDKHAKNLPPERDEAPEPFFGEDGEADSRPSDDAPVDTHVQPSLFDDEPYGPAAPDDELPPTALDDGPPQAAPEPEAPSTLEEIETPEELSAPHTQGPSLNALEGYEPIDRERPERKRLIPIEMLVLFMASAILVAGVFIGYGAYQRASRITVPDLIGTDVDIARVDLERAGLELVVDSERFSARPVDTVLDQDPTKGAKLRRGQTVHVSVSAGTEQFALPDVTGDGLLLASGRLQNRGLQIVVIAAPSNQPSDTVIATNPSPGTPVTTGDVIRLTVASNESSPTAQVVPYKFDGRTFVLDPAPSATSTVDVSLDVARRIRSLLEASGARVVVTRSVTDSATTDVARALDARDANDAVATIGLSASADPQARGLRVVRLATGQPAIVSASTALAGQLTQSLSDVGKVATPQTVTQDPVLASLQVPAARVMLGSTANDVDLAAFKDPRWADSVARAVYKTLGERYAPQ